MSSGFPTEVRDAWNRFCWDGDWYRCLKCGASHADCLHHNYGRNGGDPSFNSILNSVPLNNHHCHIKSHSLVKRNRKMLKEVFTIVVHAIESGVYTLTERDVEFYRKMQPVYKTLHCNLDKYVEAKKD